MRPSATCAASSRHTGASRAVDRRRPAGTRRRGHARGVLKRHASPLLHTMVRSYTAWYGNAIPERLSGM
eukprot:scaffold95442_cov60-Phaeocystis_antarctica.AAC.3